MISTTWRKRVAVWQNRLYLYPSPEPLPMTRMFWLATGMVTLLVFLFAGYFLIYLLARQNAFLTHAEDMGIMDQALWNTLHGNLLHQTICNIVSDTNCYSLNGISRLAIHFEPILFPLSLLYLVWPGPKLLLIVQTLVVASGAFPAFWLARLRLRSEWAGVGVSALYLLYPAQQNALVSDFHAVTFTTAFLMFTLYFLYTRRTAWLFVFAILAMACKEEIPVIIAFFGLWSIVFQHRWRTGLSLCLLALVWIGSYMLVTRFASPTGHSLLTSRYTYLGNGPIQIAKTLLTHAGSILKQHVLEHDHFFYLRLLLTPVGYLAILVPWVLVLALPSLALNLLSTDPNMHSGLYQYNAEIVPVLIFATIEAIVLLIWLTQWVVRKVQRARKEIEVEQKSVSRSGYVPRRVHGLLLLVLMVYVLFNAVRANSHTANMPFGQGFSWPQITAHTQLAQHFIGLIPPTASVSAQSDLVPHVSDRSYIYLFPYGDGDADYIFLDVTGNVYPFFDSPSYVREVKKVLSSGNYGVVEAQDGYLLLKKGLPAPGTSPYSPPLASNDIAMMLPNLPQSFCSFVYISSQQVMNPVQIEFASMNNQNNTMNLMGYNVSTADTFSESAGYLQVTTFWHVSAPTMDPLQIMVFVTDKSGKEHFLSIDFPAFYWCPTNTWKPGTVVRITSNVLRIVNMPLGVAHVSIALLPVTRPSSSIMDVQNRLPLRVLQAPRTLIPAGSMNGLRLKTLTLVP